jgi:hypothetical protein
VHPSLNKPESSMKWSCHLISMGMRQQMHKILYPGKSLFFVHSRKAKGYLLSPNKTSNA